jgi:hypothetical protein
MKKIIIALTICLQIKAQTTPPSTFIGLMDKPEIQKEDVYVGTGINKEAEDNIMWALKKYWTFGSKINTIDAQKDPFKSKKNISFISLRNYKTTGENGDYYNTQYTVINEIGVENYNNVFLLPFDDFTKISEEGKIIGSDKNAKLIVHKSLTYTMLFCSLVKNFSVELGGAFKFVRAYNAKLDKLKEKLKTTTILIPKELLDNGITVEAFKNLGFKYKIETSEEIATRIKEGKDVKNFSHLIVYKADKFNDYAYLVDIETGDLINYSSVGASAFSKTYKYMDDARMAKLLGKLGN